LKTMALQAIYQNCEWPSLPFRKFNGITLSQFKAFTRCTLL